MSEQRRLTDLGGDQPGDADGQTEERSLPEGWEMMKIQDVCEMSGGSTPKKSNEEYWDNGEILWAKPKDFNGPLIADTEEKMTEKGAEASTSKIHDPGTILLVVRSGVLRHTLPVAKATTKTTINQDIKALEADTDVIHPEYLFQVLRARAEDVRGTCKKTGTTVESIQTSVLKKYEIPVPPMEEQKAIAAAAVHQDEAIRGAEETLEKSKTLRESLASELLRTGTHEHSDYKKDKAGKFPASWNTVRLGDLLTDTRYGTDTKSNTEGRGHPTLRIPNIVNKRITLDDLKYTELPDDEYDRLRLEEDDILVIRTNGNPNYVGRCATVSEREEDFVYASYLIRLRVDEDRVLPGYIREFLNAYRGRVEMNGWIRSSAGNYNLSVSGIEKFTVPLPSLAEQQEIVDKLEAVDEMIQTNREHHKQAQRLKTGLMQDLLSGNVRTAEREIDIPDAIENYESA